MNGAIIINPWNMDEIVEAYREALLTPPETAASNHEKLFRYVTKHTASFWGQSFVAELQKIGTDPGRDKRYTKAPVSRIQETFQARIASDKLILLELDEALATLPERRIFDEIDRLAHLSRTFVYIFTGGTRAEWQDRLVHGNVGLVCEFGCFIRHPLSVRIHQSSSPADSRTPLGLVGGGRSPPMADDWIQLAEHSDDSWRDRVRPLLQFYTEHTPGARLEEREKMVVWHFGEAEREFGAWQASELQTSLEKMVGHAPVNVLLEQSRLEVRTSMVDQSVALRRILTDLGESTVGWVLATKERKEDDGMLATLSLTEGLMNETTCVFTVSIGKRPSSAQYYVDSPSELVQLLGSLHE